MQAKREQLAYTASLVVVFALPSIFLLPAAATALGLSQAVAGAWIGGNIDTSAAVSAAGAIAGEQALQLATIVKTTQNALLGVVAVALTAYFAVHVERSATSARPSAALLWERFPKFVLGFIAVSAIATSGLLTKPAITSLGNLSKWAFLLCFAGVGLNFDLRELARAGVRPLIVAALGLVVVAACSLGLVLLTSGWLTG